MWNELVPISMQATRGPPYTRANDLLRFNFVPGASTAIYLLPFIRRFHSIQRKAMDLLILYVYIHSQKLSHGASALGNNLSVNRVQVGIASSGALAKLHD